MHKLLYRDKEYLEKCIENGDCITDVAQRFHLDNSTVRKHAAKHKLKFKTKIFALDYPRDIYTGLRFGKLVIGDFVEYRKAGNSRAACYNFKCDCGTEGVMKAYYFLARKQHCGCVAKEQRKIINGATGLKLRKNGDLLIDVYKRYAKEAARSGREFTININDFKKLTKSNCHYCGSEPSNKVKRGHREYIYNGIDRKNNNIGYVIGNCLPCCTICNKAKRDLSYEEFYQWINKLINTNKILKI